MPRVPWPVGQFPNWGIVSVAPLPVSAVLQLYRGKGAPITPPLVFRRLKLDCAQVLIWGVIPVWNATHHECMPGWIGAPEIVNFCQPIPVTLIEEFSKLVPVLSKTAIA